METLITKLWNKRWSLTVWLIITLWLLIFVYYAAQELAYKLIPPFNKFLWGWLGI